MKNYLIGIFIAALLIALVQITTNGIAIYKNVFQFKNMAGVRPMEWLNFGLGVFTLLFCITVYLFRQQTGGYFFNYSLIAIGVLNVGFMLYHFFSFFGAR